MCPLDCGGLSPLDSFNIIDCGGSVKGLGDKTSLWGDIRGFDESGG